jgi:hypothetical protein
MPIWNGITYTEYFSGNGQDGWELAFSNDGSGATHSLDIPIILDAALLDTFEIGPPPNFGPVYMAQIVNAVRAFIGFPVVLPVPGAPPFRRSWQDVPVAQLSRSGGTPQTTLGGMLPMPFPNLWRMLYGVTYPPESISQQQPFLFMTKIPRIRGIGPKVPYFDSSSDPTVVLGQIVKSQNQDGNDISIHNRVRMDCQFEALPYYVLPDTDPTVQRTITTLGSGGTPGGITVTFADESQCVRFVEKLPKLNADYFTVQNGIMKFAEGVSTGIAIPFRIGKIISNIDLTYRWHQVPEEAIASQAINPYLDPENFETAIDYCLGRVNDFPFPPGPSSQGYPAGTLLLLGVGMTPFNAASGRRLYTVDFYFKFFAPGHHKIYSFKDSTNGNDYVEISSDGLQYPPNTLGGALPDGKHLYNVARFDALFWPPKVPN